MKTVIEHLSNLIRKDSVSSISNRAVVDYAIEVLHAAEWQTRLAAYRDAAGIEKVNLIAAPPRQQIENPAVDLVFMCHTDTVPHAAAWTRALDPFERDGLLYGCGACDVKGFLACLLTAISESHAGRFADGLRLVLTADEEVGCVGASQLLSAGLLEPQRVVIGEPTSLHVARAGKGYCVAEITVLGHEAHSAHPQQGQSAIYGAARLITAIEQYAAQLMQEQDNFYSPGFTTLNVGTIQGGTAKNIVPGQCKFQLEWRPLPGRPADVMLQLIKKTAEQRQNGGACCQYEMKVMRQQTGFETDADSPLVRALENLTGRAATSIPFASEASLLATFADEVVVFGPGDMRTAHSERECVPISELEEAVAVIRMLMRAS
ncbi:MAG TPA: acetylornithine deacetylase [Acidisarcina sp.]|nr:acetylornithine deacetylase [Acidisarcina sp.]